MSVGRLTLGVAALAAAAVLAGCGGDEGSSEDALPKVLAAVSQTLSQTAVSNLTLDGAQALGAAGDETVYGRGAFIFPTNLGYQAIAIPDPRGGDPIKAFLVFRPGRVYLLPIKGVALPRGKLWLSARVGKASPRADVARFVTQAESINPQLFLNEILWGGSKAEAAGDQVVRHVPFKRYRVTVDLKRALTGARSTFPAMAVAIESQLKARQAAGSTTMPVTVLVDAAGRIAQVEAETPDSGFGNATMRLGGYGVELTPSLPLRAQTVELETQPAARSPWRPET
jgi:hypothetical protein